MRFVYLSACVLWLLSAHTFSCYAQLENAIFSASDTINPSDTGKVKLHVSTMNFLRNTEYFSIIEEGQTFFGYQFQAHASYQPYKNMRIYGGLYAQKDFGNDKFTVLQPVFAINYKVNKWLFNFGQLDGSTNHRIIEPMFNIDRAITNRLENGFQAKYQSDRLWFDGWINWEQAEYHGSLNQEQLTLGLSGRYTLINKPYFKLNLPIQNLLSHRGGQIDESGMPIVSRMNTTGGLAADIARPKRFVRRIRAEQYFLMSNDFSPRITQPYKNGHAFFSTLSATIRHSEFMINYWHGVEYQSGRGTLMYNSYNVYDVYQFQRIRQLVFVRWLYYKPLFKNVYIDFRVEPIYEINTRDLQYSYSMYLSYRASIGLGKIKLK